MTRTELELYLKYGRPTGLLLRSVAILKGLSSASIAAGCGISPTMAATVLDDHSSWELKRGSIRRVAAVLGIDLKTMSLAAGQVHFFHLANARAAKGEDFRTLMRAIGLLARDGTFAELAVGDGLDALRWKGRVHAAGSKVYRALFLGRGFDIEHIPSGQWVRRTREESLVRVRNPSLEKSLFRFDLTESEFDELFQGEKAATWDTIISAARLNGVSKADVLQFIAAKSAELESSDVAQARAALSNERGPLKLVVAEKPPATDLDV
ncbi:MAG: hypothetical protein O9327_18310 [Polaromonas sp.]|nr:hypothetical protein [Polaromonas sp.]